MSRHAKDSNENFLTGCLRKMGWTVQTTNQVGNGFPDAIATRGGIIVLIEFKLEVQAKPETQLTKPQLIFREKWPAPIYIVRSEYDCVDLYKTERARLMAVLSAN